MTNRKKIDKSQDAILARGGGNATAAGVDFQAKLGAWFASQLLAERPLDARLTGKKLKSLRFETEAPVDDILIETDEGWIYIQAKTSLTFSKSKHSEFVKTIEQFVRQWLACNNGDGSLGWNRPLHPDKDRMVLALGPNAPRSLSTNLAQSLATIQTSGFVELPKTKAEAVKKFKELLERSWKDLTGRTASPSDIQGLLSLVTVQTFDFDGAHNQTATEILSHILDKPEQAGATFLAISQYCQELMKMRSGCDTAQLRSSLLGTGIPLTAPPSYRSDVESLKGFSKHIRQHLREYESTMLAGDNIRIERECTNIVVDAARSGSLLLVGEPGAGKSAVINSCAAILIEEGYDVIELAVDRLPVKSLSDLAAEIGLSHPLREVLCNWTGKQPAFLFIDALDATRGGDNEAVFRTLIADVLTFETCQWHVIASIRTFDLRMGEQFKHIFQGDPPNVIFSDPAFPNVKHILVPPWTKKEFTILLQNAPILEKAIETGGERLLELAQVPFNTRLIADLISGGLTPYNFGEINSQVQLLGLYWNHRIEKHGTGAELCIESAVNLMIESRTLQARKLDIARTDSSALDILMHENVLVQIGHQQYVTFRHHILFDYAVSRVYLRIDDLNLISDLLRHSEGLGLMLAPALGFSLQQLWNEAEGGHRSFWDAIARISGDPTCDPVSRSVAARTASELPRLPGDAIDLLRGLSLEGEPKTRSTTAFSHIVGALVVRFEDKQSVPYDPWCEVAVHATKNIADTAWPLRTLLYALYERISSDAHRAQLGLVARKLLDYCLDPSNAASQLTVSAIDFVATTHSSDIKSSRKLLKRLFEPEHFQGHADQEIPWLTRKLKPISEADPDFVAEIYELTFTETISDDSQTSLGQSQILPLSSNRRQDYDSARWNLKSFFPSFLKNRPLYAVRALIGAINGFVKREHPIDQDARHWSIQIQSKMVYFQEDRSHVWAWDINGERGHTAHGLIKAFVTHLEAVEPETARGIVDAIIERNELGVLWARTLMAASKRAEAVGDLLWPIATQEPFLTSRDTQTDAIDFLAARYPLEESATRSAFERKAMSFRFDQSARPEETRQRFLNRLFQCVGREHLITNEAVGFVPKEGSAINTLNNNRPFTIHTGVGSPDKWWWLTDDGVDVKAPEVASILAEIDDIKETFALDKKDHEIDKIDSAIDRLNALIELAADGTKKLKLPEAVVKYAYSIAAEGVAKLSHLPVKRLRDQEQTLSHIIELVINLAGIPAKPASEEEEANFESSSSWGSPNVRVNIAEAVMNICRVDGEIVETLQPVIEKLITAPTKPAARHQIAVRLTALWNTAPQLMWTLAERIASTELNRGVLSFFANYFLGRTIHADPEQVERLTFILYERSFKRTEQQTQALLKQVGSLLALLWITHGRDKPWRTLQAWIADPHKYEAELSQAISISRGSLILKYLNDDLKDAEITQRSQSFCALAVTTMADGLERYLAKVEQQNLQQHPITEAEKERGTLYAKILNHLCDEIYYASGAFRSSDGDKSALETVKTKRAFLSDMKPVLERIADVGTPATIHHLIELLDFLIPADPAEVFNLISQALLNAGRQHGYHFESMGADRFVAIVGHYLADHREIFSDRQRRQKLIACLDIFLEAGWPAARRLLYRLPELLQ